MKKNYGLELYKLIMTPEKDDLDISYVDEFGWVNDKEFYVWVNALWFSDFLKRLSDIFGYSLFDEGGIEAAIFSDCVCIDLNKCVSGYGVDLENVFPKDEYKH